MEQMYSQILEKVNMCKYEIGSRYLVQVTQLNNPKSFYVRPVNFKEDMALLEDKGTPMTSSDLKIGRRVIYLSANFKKYVRGLIDIVFDRHGDFKCTIYAIDYGCREPKIELNNIFFPKYDILCPPLAVHCQLHLCEPQGGYFDEEAIKALQFFVGTHTAKITIMAKSFGQLVVELKTVECPDDVSTMLGLLHFTTLTVGESDINLFTTSSAAAGSGVITYKYKKLKVGDELLVRVQSGDSINSFYVAEVNEYKVKLSNAHQLVAYCKRQQTVDVPAAAADGRSCGVRLKQTMTYERAIVKNITVPDNKALVKLVDWGKEMEVNFCEIKEVKSPMFTEQPAIAIYCSSTDDQMWNNGFPKFLQLGWTLRIQIKELGNGTDVPHKVNLSPDVPRK